MSVLGPNDRRPDAQLWGTTMQHLRTWRTEYVDEYSEPIIPEGVPAVREEMASIAGRPNQASSGFVSTLPASHSHMFQGTQRYPPGHPPQAVYRSPEDPPIGTMTRGTGTIGKLKDSNLYAQAQTWAHWRVEHDGKPADTRRKYRGVS